MYTKAIKAALTILFNNDTRKAAGKVILVILSPFLLFVLAITATADAGTQHNQEVISTLFEYKAIPASVPIEFKTYLESMQTYFHKIDEESEMIQASVQEGALDLIQMKALFLSMYMQEVAAALSDDTLHEYVLCFTETMVSEDKEDLEETSEEVKKTYRVLHDMNAIKSKVEALLHVTITEEMMESYQSIVSYVNPGANASTEGDGMPLSTQFTPLIEASNQKKYVGGKMSSPFMDDWRNKVSSEFGYRSEIVLPDGTVTSSAHTGLDMAAPGGTPIVAVNDGEVVYVRNHQIGLGLHLVVDHGGGKLSVYGHTSRIIVQEGDKVKRGQKIAEVGTTGYSTGDHLHLEIWENGKCQNPRNYLE